LHPGERASQAVFSIALYPEYLNLFFDGAKACPILESVCKAAAIRYAAFA
jgi:hypothetical protein